MVYIFAVVFVAQFEKQQQRGEGATGKGSMPWHVLKLCLAVSACVGMGTLLLHSMGVGCPAQRWFGAGC